jgi:hypothetical protein
LNVFVKNAGRTVSVWNHTRTEKQMNIRMRALAGLKLHLISKSHLNEEDSSAGEHRQLNQALF